MARGSYRAINALCCVMESLGGHNGVYRWFMGGGVSNCRRRGDGGCRFARWHLLG